MTIWVGCHCELLLSACGERFLGWFDLVSSPALFSHQEAKNSLVNGLFPFRSMRFKNLWLTSLKMDYVRSGKSRHYETMPKRQLVSRDHPSLTSEHREMKLHKTWSLCRPQKALKRSYRHLTSLKLRSPYHAFMEILAFLCYSVLWFCTA